MERNLISLILVKSLIFVSLISSSEEIATPGILPPVRSVLSCPSPCNCFVDEHKDPKNVTFSVVLEIECPSEARNVVDFHEFFLNRSRIWNATKFDSVHISQLPNSELVENFFGIFKFRYIRIAESNITTIHPDAFKSTINNSVEFNLINCTFSERLENGTEIFNMVERFKQLRIFRISGTNLKRVLSNAFSPSMDKLAVIR